MMKEKHISPEVAARNVAEQFGFSPNPEAIRRHMKNHGGGFAGAGISPCKPGPKPAIPHSVEKELVKMMKHFYHLGIVLTITFSCKLLEGIIEGTPAAQKINTQAKLARYIYHLIQKHEHGLSLGKVFGVDDARARWSKSYIIAGHYNAVKKVLLEHNFAKLNSSYDGKNGQPELILLEKERILSFDETKVKLDQTDEQLVGIGPRGKGKKKGTMIHSSNCFSAIATTTAAGGCLPAYIVWQSGSLSDGQVNGRANTKGPKSSIPPYRTPFHTMNEKGSVTSEKCLDYIKKVIVPAYPNLKEKPIVLLMDGCITHIRWEIIEFCVETNIILLLRPPHTTHLTQPEDRHGFGVFKREFKETKNAVLAEREMRKFLAIGHNESYYGVVGLDKSDLIDLMKGPWEIAFSTSNVLKAWRLVGISPFTRCVQYKLKAEEEENARNMAKYMTTQKHAKKMENNMRNYFAGGTAKVEGSDGNNEKKQISKTARYYTDSVSGAITSSEFVEIIRKEEEAARADEELKKAKRQKRAKALDENVNKWKRDGMIYDKIWKKNYLAGKLVGNWNNFKQWERMSHLTLKYVLAVYNIYPGQIPPVPYKYRPATVDNKFKQLLEIYEKNYEDIKKEVSIVKSEEKKAKLMEEAKKVESDGQMITHNVHKAGTNQTKNGSSSQKKL
jgi:hypothetical protein